VQLEALKAEATDDMVGRRVDIAITDPHDIWWVDATGVHSTAKSYLPQSKTFVKNLASAEAKARWVVSLTAGHVGRNPEM
jgi:hypothetical protein